jgi:hypothetical protein
MFAQRNTIRGDTTATVYDPEGNVIVTFKPRQYDAEALSRKTHALKIDMVPEVWHDVHNARVAQTKDKPKRLVKKGR